LGMSEDWLEYSWTVPPFTLKNVRVQEKNIQTVLSQLAQVSVVTSEDIPKEVYLKKVVEISDEMRNGPRPPKFQRKENAAPGKVILVHGYCSDGTPFSESDFTNYAVFRDPNANRNLDEFANLIINFANAQGIASFSIIGHSQGGLAALHLATYFWSGLDTVGAGRIIQSVGSPYQGTALAGGWAGIGGIFGVGCGSNDGLGKSGAAEWRAGIPQDKQKKVYYYTTQGSSTCSSGANWLGLDKPNDGVTSKDYSQLPYGNSQGHKSGWCHTVDMSSPSQCTDHTNNAQMSQAAAR